MLPICFELTENLSAKLREIRLDNPVDDEILTAEKLSKAIGNNRAWMSQIESRRLKKIRRDDVIKIYQYIFRLNKTEAEEKAETDLAEFINYKIELSEHQRKIIKEKRKQTGIRTDDFSIEIGKAACYMSQIESGKIKKIPIDTLNLIVKKLGCNIGDITENNRITNYEDYSNRNTNDIISENILLKQENELLKKKLESILQIINM